MKINKLNIALWSGFACITGILVWQIILLRQAVLFEEKKFEQKAHVILLEVAKKLNASAETGPSQGNPIEKRADDTFIVNVNTKFDSLALNFYLHNEMDKFDLLTDVEYSMYDCHTEKMQPVNYIRFGGKGISSPVSAFPKKENGVYYFSLHFPFKRDYIYNSLRTWIILSGVMLLVLLMYAYSAFTILQQKKYAGLQKDFINNMTHEFKTPISSILISAEFLAGQNAISNDEKLKKYTGIISQQASQLNHHVEKVLNLAKTENNATSMEPIITDIIPLIHTVTGNLMLKHPDACIHTQLPDTCLIRADAFHFSNLVYNLLDNSIKYSASTAEIWIALERKDQLILLSFTDNGIGMDKKDLSQVLKKFYRVPGGRNRMVSGFGLGLYYVKKICDGHHWKFFITSETGKGTHAVISIPAYDK